MRAIFTYAIVFAGMGIFGFHLITNQLFIAALVHLAVASIDIGSPLDLQRIDVYPNHQTEGYRTFWVAFSGVVLLIIGGLFLVSATITRRSATRMVSRVVFATLVIAMGLYLAWFKLIEFPRLSPELASAGFAALWTDFIAGVILILGLAYAAARFFCSHDAERSIPYPIALRPSWLATIAAIGIVFGEACIFADDFRQSFAISMMFTSPTDLILRCLETISYLLVMPDVLLSILLLAYAIGTVYRILFSDLQHHRVPEINGPQFVIDLVNSIALLIVAVPILAIFGFCWWFGPFI